MPVVELVVPADEVELAADALWQAGPSAVEEHDLGDGRVRLRADVADLGRVAERWPVEVVALAAGELDEALDAWRAFAAPVRAGRRVVLQPAWTAAPPAGPDDLVIRLDPGRTFGSGSHPSTRLVLAVLEDRLVAGDRVLDVGTGSGVLAVVAARLGAASAVGTDVDPATEGTVAANAAANGVADRVTVAARPGATVPGPFELVLANIGLRVLLDLADDLCAATAPGGHLVLAGLLEGQVDEVVAACDPCAEVERRTEDGWSVVVLRR